MILTKDKEQFVQIINAHKGILYKVIHAYCKDKEDKKDLEQEILVQLWMSLKNYKQEYKLSTWIYKVAMNVSISFYRSKVKRDSRLFFTDEPLFLDTQITDDGDSKRSMLDAFIDQLNSLNKAIIILYLDDHSYKEIAEIVGITETNVATKVSRIKKSLKANVSKLKNS